MAYRTVDPVNIPGDEEVAYLAGLIDGEGHINIRRMKPAKETHNPTHSVRVTVTNTDEKMIDWLVDTVGGSKHLREREEENWSDSWNWEVYGDNAEQLLDAVRPYLVTKRTHADLGIMLQGTKQQGKPLTDKTLKLRDSIYYNLKRLNSRGRFNQN